MPTPVPPAEFAARGDRSDWRYLVNRLEATFRAGSFAAAAGLVGRVAEAAEAAGHHPDVDVRYPDRVHVTLTTHAKGTVTDLDVELAGAISALATEIGATSDPGAASIVELAIDAVDIDAIRPFWVAVLGYVDHGDAIDDPVRRRPSLWFQSMDEPRPQRNRMHVDVHVAHELAERRVADAIAAGGTLVTDEFAPSWWVLADAEGNEACVCTWQAPAGT